MAMALNSVNTNIAAGIALQSLELTNTQLAASEKQISTGYRVADATDDGAAFAVAQRVRSDVGALTSANTALGGVEGLLSVTSSALTDISNTLNSARDVLVQLSNSDISGTERSQYVAQYQSFSKQIKSFVEDASYDGKTLIGNITGGAGSFGNIAVVRNEVGSTYGIATYGGSTLYTSIAFTTAQLTNSTTVASLITATATPGTFINQLNDLGTQIASYGAATNYVTNQVTYNTDKITALNDGLGALVDANLAQESATLQSLQIRQQLGTQALSLANQAPQALLSLFK
jgi:flagellin